MRASKASNLPINPEILVWARTRAGISVEEAASKAHTAPERVFEWESGSASPTPKQARRLAKAYERPFLEFFARQIPEVQSVNLVPDFRLYSSRPSEPELRALRGVQEWAEEQRVNALSLIEEIGERPPVFSMNLRFSVGDNPDKAAEIAREAMGFALEDQMFLSRAERDQIPAVLRDKIEAMGVLVLKQNGLTKLRARGMCLYAEPLPVIVFGGEAPSAQAFTLAHEFGHVLTSTSAISGGFEQEGGSVQSGQEVEGWCNAFAASFLIPAGKLNEIEAPPPSPSEAFDDRRLAEVSQAFGVSRHAMLVRLVSLKYVKPEFYWDVKRPEFLAEEASFKSFGRPKYYGKRYINSRGHFYTSLVLEAWGAGRITGHNAAEYMGIKNLSHLDDIRNDYRV